MLQSQRQEKILKYLEEKHFLSVSHAVELFNSSTATINRDFKELAEKQLLERVHGGARPSTQKNTMIPFAFRRLKYSSEKENLAKKAVTLLKPNQVIFIDGGTTTFHMGMCIPKIPLHIITNSLRLAALLEEKTAKNPEIEITMTGGYLHKQSGILLGPNTAATLTQYHANWAFLSAGGLDISGIYNTNELVTETERTMIENADKTVILADHSKIDKKALCKVCDLENIDILVTNKHKQHCRTLKQIAKSVQIFEI